MLYKKSKLLIIHDLKKKSMKKKDIKEYNKKNLSKWLEKHEIKPFRSNQIFKWIYLKQTDSFELMTDLGKNLRDLLKKHFTINRLKIEEKEVSKDGTIKYLFKLEDENFTECVLIPSKERVTLCISTQVGCAQGCKFCLTARGGFIRNLTFGEIISQIRDIQHDISGKAPVKNVVFMGMGEPFANYDNVIDSLSVLTDSDFGLKISARRVTVSTCGLINKIPDFGKDTKANLAISLNATDDSVRSKIMPVNKTYPLEKLLEKCREYSRNEKKKITFEYILMKGINDSLEDAKRLPKLLHGINSKINLIAYNDNPDSEFKSPDKQTMEMFQKYLLDHGMVATARKSRGKDISAACGQLSANKKSKK